MFNKEELDRIEAIVNSWEDRSLTSELNFYIMVTSGNSDSVGRAPALQARESGVRVSLFSINKNKNGNSSRSITFALNEILDGYDTEVKNAGPRGDDSSCSHKREI